MDFCLELALHQGYLEPNRQKTKKSRPKTKVLSMVFGHLRPGRDRWAPGPSNTAVYVHLGTPGPQIIFFTSIWAPRAQNHGFLCALGHPSPGAQHTR